MLLHACSLVGLTSQHATSFQLHMTLWKSSESSAIMCVCVFACVSMCMCACRSVCDRVWLLHVASLITRELMSFMSFHMTLLDAFGRLWFGSGAAPSPIEARARAVGVGVQHLQCSQCRARRGLRDRHHHRGNRSGIRRWRQWSRTEIDCEDIWRLWTFLLNLMDYVEYVKFLNSCKGKGGNTKECGTGHGGPSWLQCSKIKHAASDQ